MRMYLTLLTLTKMVSSHKMSGELISKRFINFGTSEQIKQTINVLDTNENEILSLEDKNSLLLPEDSISMLLVLLLLVKCLGHANISDPSCINVI